MKPADLPSGEPASPSSVIEEEARVWLRHLTSGEATEQDRQVFLCWYQCSQAHAKAFAQAKRHWQLLKPVAGQLLQKNADIAAYHRRTLRGPAVSRRAFLAFGTGAAAAAAVLVIHPPFALWPAPRVWNADFSTAAGEQRRLDVSDHVSVILNTRTRVRQQEHDNRIVGISLLEGETAVDMLTDHQTFSVHSGVGRSLANSGQFEVRMTGEKTCVTCMQGSVRVEHPVGIRELQRSEQLVYDAQSLGEVRPVDLSRLSPWREGELSFHQHHLREVIDEINRYRSGRVILMNKTAGDTPVSGRFSITSLDAALLQIQHSIGLEARALPGGLLLLS